MTDDDSTRQWAIFGSFAAVAGAVVCCVGPALVLSIGAGSASVAGLSLEAYRPLFGVAAAASLAVAFYRTYGSKVWMHHCGDDSCGPDSPDLVDQLVVWGSALLVGSFFLWPYLPSPGIAN